MSVWDKIFRFDYSKDLHTHLKGWAIDCNAGYTRQSTYQVVCFIMLIAVLLGTANYYYGLLNRPQFSKLSAWLFNFLCLGLIVFFSAYILAAGGMKENAHCESLHFYGADCLLFALTALTYTLLFYVLLSVIIKWWSLNNKKVPF